MKVITITTHNIDLITEVVNKAGHVVVSQSNDLAHVISMLLQHTPHVCFVETSEKPEPIHEKAVALFPATRFISLGYNRGSTWTQIIRDALKEGPVELPWNPKEPEKRMTLMDLRYFAFCNRDKLKGPSQEEGWKTGAEVEQERLFWMMHTARQIADRAEAYRDAVSVLDGGECQEVTYRVLRGSFKSVAWARDQVARYLAYLAHFVPYADVDCLMPPAPAPAAIRFLHYESQPELTYALFCLSVFGFSEDLARPLLEIALWRYEGGTNEDLTRTAIIATGFVSILKTIVISHAIAIGWLTDPDTLARLEWKMPRPLRRTLQSYRDFWGFRQALDLDNPKSLLPLLERLASTRMQEPVPASYRVPTFAVYYNATQTNPTNKTT